MTVLNESMRALNSELQKVHNLFFIACTYVFCSNQKCGNAVQSKFNWFYFNS